MASFTVPAYGASVVVSVLDSSWMVPGEWLYIADAGGTGVAGQLQVQSVAPGSVTLVNPPSGTSGTPRATQFNDGLLAQVSGNTTDFVDGTNNSADLGATILGQATITNPGLTKSIIVPRYAGHPDRIWTPGTYDDHFDGASLNAKWTQVIGSGAISVSGSHVHLNAVTPTSALYATYITQGLPAESDLDIRMKLRFSGYLTLNAGTYAQFFVGINGGNSLGVRFRHLVIYGASFAPQTNSQRAFLEYGANFGTVLNDMLRVGEIAPYWRFSYSNSSKQTVLYFSFDGVTWIAFSSGVTGAQSLFSTTPPNTVQIVVQAANSAFSLLSVDWFRIQ